MKQTKLDFAKLLITKGGLPVKIKEYPSDFPIKGHYFMYTEWHPMEWTQTGKANSIIRNLDLKNINITKKVYINFYKSLDSNQINYDYGQIYTSRKDADEGAVRTTNCANVARIACKEIELSEGDGLC